MSNDEKQETNAAANRVMAAFDKLTSTYTRLFNLCYDALGPGKTQAERNQVRDAVHEYISSKDVDSGKE